MPILRIVGAIALGLMVGGIVVFVVQLLGMVVYPVSEGTDLQDPEQLKNRIENAPALAKAVVWVAWTLGAFAGSWVAARIAGPGYQWWALVIGLGITGGALSVLIQFPGQGVSMWVIGLTLPLIASILVCRRAGRVSNDTKA